MIDEQSSNSASSGISVGRMSSLAGFACMLVWTSFCLLGSQKSRTHVSAVVTSSFDFVDIKVHYAFVNSTTEDAATVLLLHGQRYTSDDWVKLLTLDKLAAAGFRVMAIDLPGYGQTPRLPYLDDNMRAEVVHQAFQTAGGRHKILVSPSASGYWAMPYLERYYVNLLAWVALAPSGTQGWGGPPFHAGRQVRLLAMYGQEDPAGSDATLMLKMFDHGNLAVVPGGGHAWYMEQPEPFHSTLLPYLKMVSEDARKREQAEAAAQKPKPS